MPLLQAGLHQNKSRPSGSLSWGTLCSWVSAWAQAEFSPFWKEDVSQWKDPWPLLRCCLAGRTSITDPPFTLSPLQFLCLLWKDSEEVNCSKPESPKHKLSTPSLTSHPSDHGSHSLDYSPLISISTREMLVESISTRASPSHLQDEVLEKVSHQAMMLPCGLTGVQWETRSRLSIQ